MKILLDTHAALWWWADSPELGSTVRHVLAASESEIYFSAASAYEIHQKSRLGKLQLPEPLLGEGLARAVTAEGWKPLPLLVRDASAAAALEHPHRDPFDRMLAAQALSGTFTLATKDSFFQTLGLNLIW